MEYLNAMLNGCMALWPVIVIILLTMNLSRTMKLKKEIQNLHELQFLAEAPLAKA
jgi:hypothetical protein